MQSVEIVCWGVTSFLKVAVEESSSEEADLFIREEVAGSGVLGTDRFVGRDSFCWLNKHLATRDPWTGEPSCTQGDDWAAEKCGAFSWLFTALLDWEIVLVPSVVVVRWLVVKWPRDLFAVIGASGTSFEPFLLFTEAWFVVGVQKLDN